MLKKIVYFLLLLPAFVVGVETSFTNPIHTQNQARLFGVANLALMEVCSYLPPVDMIAFALSSQRGLQTAQSTPQDCYCLDLSGKNIGPRINDGSFLPYFGGLSLLRIFGSINLSNNRFDDPSHPHEATDYSQQLISKLIDGLPKLVEVVTASATDSTWMFMSINTRLLTRFLQTLRVEETAIV